MDKIAALIGEIAMAVDEDDHLVTTLAEVGVRDMAELPDSLLAAMADAMAARTRLLKAVEAAYSEVMS